jgi:hypothetical protein
MLKRELFIGLLIAVFSFGVIGVTLADDPGQNLSEAINTYVETNPMADAEFTQPTAIQLEHGNLNVRDRTVDPNPMVCLDDHAQEAIVIASNDCTDLFDDLYRS